MTTNDPRPVLCGTDFSESATEAVRRAAALAQRFNAPLLSRTAWTSALSSRSTSAIGDVARLLIEGSQQEFPVLDGERVVCVLTHARLFEVLRERGEWTPVAEAMERDFRMLRLDERLDGALFQAEPGRTVMPVVRDGCLVGLLTAENIGELLMIPLRTSTARVRAAAASIGSPCPLNRQTP